MTPVFNDFNGVIVRAIVSNKDFVGAASLKCNAGQNMTQRAGFVVGADDEGGVRLGHGHSPRWRPLRFNSASFAYL